MLGIASKLRTDAIRDGPSLDIAFRLVAATDWPEYRVLPWELSREIVRHPLGLDGGAASSARGKVSLLWRTDCRGRRQTSSAIVAKRIAGGLAIR